MTNRALRHRLLPLVLAAGFLGACGGSSGSSPSPATLSYATNPCVYYVGDAITPNTPIYSVSSPSFSVAPALPTGLSLLSSGTISGTPTQVTASAVYTVTASNGSVSASAALTIEVKPAVPIVVAPSDLVYGTNPAVWMAGLAIAPNTPSSGGGAITSYRVSPSLPAGLSLHATTGVISGTPSATTVRAAYVITGSNTVGSTDFTLTGEVRAAGVPGFVSTGSMTVVRMEGPSAAPLASGKVLVTGGIGLTAPYGLFTAISSAETYDPATGTFTTTGSMTIPRNLQTSTLLANGKVLVAGGNTVDAGHPAPVATATAELYDPVAGTFAATGSMSGTRSWHVAILLLNGKVLVLGNSMRSTSAEVYDPGTGTFSTTGPMTVARGAGVAAVLLANGKVLVAGGRGDLIGTEVALASAEVYDPATGTFTATGSMNFARISASATLLANGSVLIAGGYTEASGSPLRTELYDPATGLFTSSGSIGAARSSQAAVLLPSGKVLLAGGASGILDVSDALASAELYNVTAGSSVSVGSMTVARSRPRACLLSGGNVFMIGGDDKTRNADLYVP